MLRPPNLVRDWTPQGKVIFVAILAALAGIVSFLLIPTKWGFGG